jgi:hypothetical protein
MRYLLMIYGEESIDENMSEAEMGELMQAYGAFGAEIEKAGVVLASERLCPVATASTVRVRAEKALITDGPFAETKEALGGYYLIDVKDLDEANAWAAKIPSAVYGSVEVRPIWEMEAE